MAQRKNKPAVKAKAAVPQPGTGLIDNDPWLEPFRERLAERFQFFQSVLNDLNRDGGLLGSPSKAHEVLGFHRGSHEGQSGLWYREWAPEAESLNLIGDFNNWDRQSHPLQLETGGVWTIFLPDHEDGKPVILHGSKLKVHVKGMCGYSMDRIPAFIRRMVQEEDSIAFSGQYWNPRSTHVWQNSIPSLPKTEGIRIYEAHPGMASEEGKVGTWKEFSDNILPNIADLGYNAVQLMAVMEHPYYGSFGYHVSNFYAPSSRFGTPEDLKDLIDKAHGLGLIVIMDLIHSHCVKNTSEGLNMFDGTPYQYFHDGGRGQHVAWDSLCFDYSKKEVRSFLLSNIRFWMEEYHFDGFRMDGITSMLYHDHGLGRDFSCYDDYFNPNCDWDSLVYLMLANELAHQINPNVITIAEDMSGMPGMGRPVHEGGIGFDYRLAMGVPDYWIKVIKEKTDESWQLNELFGTLLNRRHTEKHIGYAESHDQALVGDKTLAFRLMDEAMYWHMDKKSQDLRIDRGLALHKMIRLITFSLSGEGYLTFMGNEFGHPEWIDFPREGNKYSYHYARRQWSLAERDDLRYQGLRSFDKALMALDKKFHLLTDSLTEQLAVHEQSKQLIYRRGPLVFVFNFHPSLSYSDLQIPVADAKDYKVVLDTDWHEFEGLGRTGKGVTYPLAEEKMYGRPSTLLYLPCRSAQVLAPV